MSWGMYMQECSLCKSALPPEGGAILFADARGVPFEVCGKCEETIGVLRESADDAEVESALKYMSDCAENNVMYRDTYDTLMEFLERAEPEEPPAGEGLECEDPGQPDDSGGTGEDVGSVEDAIELVERATPEVAKAGKRKFWPVVLIVVVVGFLVLAYVLGGFHIG